MIDERIKLYRLSADHLIPVRVLQPGPRPGTAWVQALGGRKPFIRYSPGGPFKLESSVVLEASLRDLPRDDSLHRDFEEEQRVLNGAMEENYGSLGD